MSILLWIILVTFLNGLIALVGAFSLFVNEKALRKIIFLLVSLSAGVLLTGGLLHLFAESIEILSINSAVAYLLFGFTLFFLIEKFLRWHHCHDEECETHIFTYMILFGDGVHNFIDGLVIAASFLVDVQFGIITTLVIIAHEIPQELGDFGVLLHGGLSKTKALLYNFISQLTAMVGGILGYFLASSTELEMFSSYLLPFAAGGFIYIATSDLIPELHKEVDAKRSILSFSFFLIGIFIMVGLKVIGG